MCESVQKEKEKENEELSRLFDVVCQSRECFTHNLLEYHDSERVLKLIRQYVCDPNVAEFVHFRTDLFERICANVLVLQTACNAATSSSVVAEFLWKDFVESRKVNELIVKNDRQCVLEPICAMIYNMSVNSAIRKERLYSFEFGVELVQLLVLKSISDQHFEDLEESFFWIFVILKNLCTSGYLNSFLSYRVGPSTKIALLHVLQHFLKDSSLKSDSEKHLKSWISLFLEELENMRDFQSILSNEHTIDLIYHITELINLSATLIDQLSVFSIARYYADLLNFLNIMNEKPSKRQERESRREQSEGIFYGLESSIMRMIANVSNHIEEFRPSFGECGGLEAVLNRCIIDDQNPYIREWSILSIRNLTRNCLPNQDRIRSLEKITDKQEILQRIRTQAN